MDTVHADGKCPLKLNFGCGSDIKEGWCNVDAHIDQDFDYSHLKDTWILEGKIVSPHALPSNHFESIDAIMVMEHLHYDLIPNTLFCLYRFLKDNGTLKIIVPNFLKLAKDLIQNEAVPKGSLEYVDNIRNINNEFLDPTFEDMGFIRGHQSIWTPRLAERWLRNEGYRVHSWAPFGVEDYHLKIIAIKPEGNPYGSPNKD